MKERFSVAFHILHTARNTKAGSGYIKSNKKKIHPVHINYLPLFVSTHLGSDNTPLHGDE